MLTYACINMTLQEKGIFTSRSLTQKTLQNKGLRYVSELALQNVKDLYAIVQWNAQNGYKGFRMSSNIFPWHSTYKLEDLKDFPEILQYLSKIKDMKQRLTFHPDHFIKLSSSDDVILNNGLKDIEQHSRIMDYLSDYPSHYNKINIHVGGAYGDKKAALVKFVENYNKLSDNAKKRLTVENDDKQGLFSVKDLMWLNEQINIPIVFDYHHHKLHSDGVGEREAFEMAYSTWGVIPVFHYSESGEGNKRGHSNYVNGPIETYGREIDVVIEAKMKELAVEKIREKDLTRVRA